MAALNRPPSARVRSNTQVDETNGKTLIVSELEVKWLVRNVRSGSGSDLKVLPKVPLKMQQRIITKGKTSYEDQNSRKHIP
jgi:hypothetical protein